MKLIMTTMKGGTIMQVGKTSTFELMERALTASAWRQQLLANNIANVDTPGYKRFDLSLRQAIENGTRQLPASTIFRQTNTSLRPDGNNVDIEQEMTQVAENSLYFEAVQSSVSKQLSMLRYLINEGRR